MVDPKARATERLLLLETHQESGETARVWLDGGASGLTLRREGFGPEPELLPLVPGAVQRVMLRYGGVPSEDLVSTVENLAAALTLEDQSTLSTFRFRPRYDVIAKDYIVWRCSGESARLELAVSVAAALTHLGRAALGFAGGQRLER